MALSFVPEKIIVGVEKSYRQAEAKENKTKLPLAYVIYKDEKGKLRKEKSWNDWRDQNVAPKEFDNIPMEGFKFLRTVQRSTEWFGSGRNMWRVLHPNGFQFEITSNNLEAIFHEIGINKGGIIQAKCVIGWQGVALLLIPEGTELYQEFVDSSKRITAVKIKKAAIKCGNKVTLKDGRKVTFLGKFCHLITTQQSVDDHGELAWAWRKRVQPTYTYKYKWTDKEVIIDEKNGIEIKSSFEVISIDETSEIPKEVALKTINNWLDNNDNAYIIFAIKPSQFQITKVDIDKSEVTKMINKTNYYSQIFFADYENKTTRFQYYSGTSPNERRFYITDGVKIIDDTTYTKQNLNGGSGSQKITTENDIMILNPFWYKIEIPEYNISLKLDM